MKKLTMLVAALLMTIGASAESEVIDGVTWNYSISSGAATINKGSYSGNLTIPSTLGGYPVKSIANGAFQGCAGLLSMIKRGFTIVIGQ